MRGQFLPPSAFPIRSFSIFCFRPLPLRSSPHLGPPTHYYLPHGCGLHQFLIPSRFRFPLVIMVGPSNLRPTFLLTLFIHCVLAIFPPSLLGPVHPFRLNLHFCFPQFFPFPLLTLGTNLLCMAASSHAYFLLLAGPTFAPPQSGALFNCFLFFFRDVGSRSWIFLVFSFSALAGHTALYAPLTPPSLILADHLSTVSASTQRNSRGHILTS